MRTWRIVLALPLLVVATGVVRTRVTAPRAAAGEDPGGGANTRWRHDPIWDDGKAEFSAYEIVWRRYGNLYEGSALLVLVKEPWAPELNVKADRPRTNGFDVLKLNHIRDVTTGIYTYHQMASVYLRRDSGALVKLAATSSEACGVSTALVVGGRLETHSYFDGDADRSIPYPEGVVPEDGLPAFLRDYVNGQPPPALEVFPLLLMGRYSRLEPRRYTVERRDLDVEVPAGRYAAVEISLHDGDDRLEYVFDAAHPFRLLRFRRSDGTEYRLTKSERISYWRMHDPGDDAWFPESVR